MDKELHKILNEYELENRTGILELLSELDRGIMVVDKNYKVIHYSEQLEKIESLKQDYVIGKNIFELFPDMTKQDSTIYQCINEGKKVVDIIKEYETLGGKSVKVLNSTLPLFKDGEIVAALDISNSLHNMKKIITSQKSNNEEHAEEYSFEQIKTVSPLMKKAINYAKRASMQDAPVLLLGETGTGKELLSQGIHYDGLRREAPFLALNCGAIPNELTESILFGTEKGGFTGAIDNMGLFEQANGGTLMLDEINSMSINLQVKLLRVLQEGVFRRVGGKEDIRSDVRIISTSNQDLMESIEKGIFRSDLYYRISVISIEVPPLKNRQDDIEFLTKYYIDFFCRKLGRKVSALNQEVMENLCSYTWPGNVRELHNVIEGILCIIPEDEDIKIENFPRYMRKSEDDGKRNNNNSGNKHEELYNTLQEQLARHEKQIIIEYITKYNSITQAAHHLGLSRQSLQYRMKRLDINREKFTLKYDD